MKTEKAVEEVKQVFWVKYGKFGNERADEVITLLKQGEKFEKMWGWLDNTISAYCGDPKYFHEYSTKEIIKIMSDLEQKYFPKEASK